ncbi:MAG: GvpL/GvpF family gas vesicle protein [Bacillota bacterium]|jgi:hypothetical protein
MENKELIRGFFEEELNQVIREAKLTALQHVKERLTRKFEDLMMEEAIKQINTVFRKDKLDELNQLSEFTELNELVPEKKSSILLYLFGITGVDGERVIFESNLKGMVNEAQVYPVRHKELVAFVCTVPQVEFNETKIQELVENRDWLEEKAERHQEVISHIAKNCPVIPMGFSTLYSSEEQLKLFLADNYHDLTALLKKIRNKSEWSLKILLDEDKFKDFLQKKDEGINKLMEEMPLNLSGKEYLLKKRLANRIERKAFDLAEEVHRRLCRFSSEAVLNKPLPKEVTGRKERMILNGAYLLEDTQKEDFFHTVSLLEETEKPRGFIFEISGPWPCYNFCQISSNST